MKNIFLVTPIVISVIFTMVSVSQAERFHDKDGHEIEILWKQKGKKKLTAWGGGISGGKRTCKQMNYSIRFKNSESHRSAYVDGYIKDYRPTGRNTFKGSDDIYKRSRKFAQRSAKNAWYVRSYSIDCLN